MLRKIAIIVAGALLLGAAASAVNAEPIGNRGAGDGKCLDIVNDGTNNRLTIADCANVTGQHWTVHMDANGFKRLKTEFTGPGKCLDIVNDGRNDRVEMADCGNFTGQHWIFVAADTPGVFWLRTEFTGPHRCLDVVDGNRLRMTTCGPIRSQFWVIPAD